MYNGITSKGSQYLAKCQAEGLPIKLSKVKIGNGTIQDLENPYNFTDVKSIKQEFEISEKSQVEEQLKIKVQIDNTSLEEGYFTKEIGIYADDNGQEILYWYINDGDQASWLPPASVSPVKFKYTFNIQVTTTETVIVNFTGKELWVDREFLNTELVKKLDKGTVPNSLNTAEKIVAALQGNGGLKFDENLLYLNDKGTKKKGVYYLDRLAEGIFECLEQTEETVNNSAKFKNISNKENSDRLDNLSEIYLSISDNDTNDSILEKINSELTKGFFSLVVIFKNTTKNFNILLKKTNLNKIKGIQIIFQKWNSSGEVIISNLASDNLTSGIGDEFNGASYKGTMVGATLTVKTSSGGVYLIQSAHLFNKS